MKQIHFTKISFVLVCLFFPSPTKAFGKPVWVSCPPDCDYRPSNYIERFLDLNHNKYLDDYELKLVFTHFDQNWPIADTNYKQMFDFTGNHLLEPVEESQYKAFLKSSQKEKRKIIIKQQTLSPR